MEEVSCQESQHWYFTEETVHDLYPAIFFSNGKIALLLRIENLVSRFPERGPAFSAYASNDISLDIPERIGGGKINPLISLYDVIRRFFAFICKDVYFFRQLKHFLSHIGQLPTIGIMGTEIIGECTDLELY